MIRFENVSMTYDDRSKAMRNASLLIDKGEFVFLVGPSGSGKSTFLRLLLREIKPSQGTIQVDEYDLSTLKNSMLPKYRRKLGVVFQDFKLLGDRNVYENVALAQHVIGASAREIKKEVPAVLNMVGLSAKYKNFPSQLSGGEKQRVAIARALVNQPEILLADEPTGNLDPKTAAGIMQLLEEIHGMGTTVIVVTHDLRTVEKMGHRVIRLDRGVLTEE